MQPTPRIEEVKGEMSAERWKRPGLRARTLAGNEPAWLLVHPRASYVRAAVLATPPWCSAAMLRSVSARRRPGEVLDHIVPLVHPSVCGLNVPWNLQPLPRLANAAKSNGWHPDQVEIEFPKQLRLML